MTDIRIRILHDEDAERQVRRIALFLADLRPFWSRVVRLFRQWERLQFDSEGAFWTAGVPWTPLSPAYAERKRILWGDRPILQASGQMKRAALNPERRTTPTSLTLIIDDAGTQHGPVAQYHQEGDGVPMRPLVFETLPPLARFELEREGDAYIAEILRAL